MKIHVPRVPRRPTRHEHVLTELGFPAPAAARLDEEARELADHYDGLVGEMAALARRGWVREYDCENELDADGYARIIAQAVQPTGVRRVELDLSEGLLTIGVGDDRRELEVGRPEEDGDTDWLDLELILACIDAVCDTRGWVVVVNADDLHAVAIGVVPAPVWARFERDDLTGVLDRWRPLDTDGDEDEDGDVDGELHDDVDDDVDDSFGFVDDDGLGDGLDGDHDRHPTGSEHGGRAADLGDDLSFDRGEDRTDDSGDGGGGDGSGDGGADPLRWN